MSRPKEFNPHQALEKAMQVFWHKGYEATSMQDLLTAMDINRGSLYATYGDKRKLFLKAMDLYCTGGGVGSRISILSQPGPAIPLIRQFVESMLDFALSDPQRRGCLIANTAMELASHQHAIAKKVSERLQLLEAAFFKLLTRAKQEGELGNGKDPLSLARVLVTMMQGTIVMIKAGTPADVVRQTAETALSILD